MKTKHFHKKCSCKLSIFFFIYWTLSRWESISNFQLPVNQLKTPMAMTLLPLSVYNETTDQTPKVGFVTFTHLKSTDRFENLIFPSIDYWIPDNEVYYVVLANQWKLKYYQIICQSYPNYCSRIHPIFVDCPEGQWMESPCCKQEKGMLYMIDKGYDWISYHDDDMYILSQGLRRHLSAFDSTEPLIATAQGLRGPAAKRPPSYLGQFGYRRQYSPYKCKMELNFTFPWGQPVVYSKAALQLVAGGFRTNGLVAQCIEYNVTHDVGNAIFHWMYAPIVKVIPIRINMRPDTIGSESFGSHGVHKALPQDPTTVVTMKDVHEIFTKVKFRPRAYTRNKFIVSGFLETETYQLYGSPTTWGSVWHTMPVKDCLGDQRLG